MSPILDDNTACIIDILSLIRLEGVKTLLGETLFQIGHDDTRNANTCVIMIRRSGDQKCACQSRITSSDRN